MKVLETIIKRTCDPVTIAFTADEVREIRDCIGPTLVGGRRKFFGSADKNDLLGKLYHALKAGDKR